MSDCGRGLEEAMGHGAGEETAEVSDGELLLENVCSVSAKEGRAETGMRV